MTVPDEAVEAAAEAIWLARPMQRTTDGSPLPFAEAKGYERRRHLDQARHALEAAAPFIAAQAWDEGHESGFQNAAYGTAENFYTNPYRSGT